MPLGASVTFQSVARRYSIPRLGAVLCLFGDRIPFRPLVFNPLACRFRGAMLMPGMRVFVTGASGFVGRHLVAHLRTAGDDVTDHRVDVTDPEAVIAEFSRCRPESVYHLAAQADVGASWSAPAATLRVNVEGTFNVLDAALRAGVKRVVAVSSADVYGRLTPDQLPVAETAPMHPVTPYGASKAAAEMVCLQAGSGSGLEVVRVRAFNHLGPGQSDRFVASALAARIASNEYSGSDSVKVGNLDTRRDFTDVRDVVRAYRLLSEHGVPGEAYNVCSGKARVVRQLAERLLSRSQYRMRIETDAKLFRPADVTEMRGDPSKLQEATGWQPRIPMSETLDDLLNYWRHHTARIARTAATAQIPTVR